MRNMKKFLALVLAMLMVCSMAVMTVGAADEADYTDAAQNLAALKVMKGNENGDLMLENGVTRYQTALFFVQALTGETDAAVWGAEKKSANFADVIDYATAIDYAYGLGIVKGRGNGVFGYNDAIIYQDMIVMAVRALGYETADMSYPYGHILAAQKLGLTDDIDLINYKAELKRGETAQLIWNMLNIPTAVVDPLTDKVLYPGETGLSGAISEELKEELANRTTLLEDAGFAADKVTTTVVEFVEADDEDDVDTVVLGNGWEVAAADLGITADTAKVTYLGLPVTVFVDCAEDEFVAKYADDEATVVFADFAEYTVVANTGDAANIKYVVVDSADSDKTYVSLGGVKFTNKNYEGELYIWDNEDGWTKQTQEAWADLATSFRYDTKEDEYASDAGNTYGEVAYRVVAVEDDKDIVEVLYTPYEFGQYIERDLTWAVNAEEETFTLIGKYTADAVTNLDDETTNFKEYFLGNNQTPTTAKVSKSRGELSLNVTVEGEDIESGDFMFYAYNELDNILTVAKNVGTLETGRLTSVSATKGYKINGEFFTPGFADLFALNMVDDADIKGDYIEKLETGKDNVKFLAVGGNVVYMVPYAGESESTDYNFAVISTDAELMADLLDMSETKYAKALTGTLEGFEAGLYVDDGYVVVAMLDLATGEWGLANIEGVSLSYDAEEEEFATAVDVATLAKYTEITDSLNGKEDYIAAAKLITETALVTVVEAEDDVYTIAALNNTLIDSVANEKGLVFSAKGATNAIKADSDADVKAASVTTNEDTVIVAINGATVGVRTGVQNAKADIDAAATYYAAGADLIVLTTTVDVAAWGEKSILSANENYFIITADVTYEYESTDEEDVYALTIEGLYDLKNFEMVDEIVATGSKTEISNVTDLLDSGVGNVLKLNADGELVEGSTVVAALEALYAEDELTEATITAFDGDQFITITEIAEANGSTPVSNIVVNVATVDLTDIDWTEMDLGTMYVDTEVTKEYDGVSVDTFVEDSDVEYYAYAINLDTEVAELNGPEAEVLDNFVIDMMGEDIVVLDKDGVSYTITVEMSAVAAYDKETDTVTVNVVKTVK